MIAAAVEIKQGTYGLITRDADGEVGYYHEDFEGTPIVFFGPPFELAGESVNLNDFREALPEEAAEYNEKHETIINRIPDGVLKA